MTDSVEKRVVIGSVRGLPLSSSILALLTVSACGGGLDRQIVVSLERVLELAQTGQLMAVIARRSRLITVARSLRGR